MCQLASDGMESDVDGERAGAVEEREREEAGPKRVRWAPNPRDALGAGARETVASKVLRFWAKGLLEAQRSGAVKLISWH